MSKSTVVSVFPFDVNEVKPGVYPGNFHIPAAKNGPSVVIVPDAIAYLYDIDGKGTAIDVMSEKLAKSIVDDFYTTFIGVTSDYGPGLFWLPGEFSKAEITGNPKYKPLLDKAYARQEEWFKIIVRLADDDWARYGVHRAISDLQRYAADVLHLDRPWARAVEQQKFVLCVACKQTISDAALVCSHCRTIQDSKKWEASGLKQL